jgi:hypothetical protein
VLCRLINCSSSDCSSSLSFNVCGANLATR